MTRILGVDPGSRRAGFAVLEMPRAWGGQGGWGRVEHGVISASGEVPDRLAKIAGEFARLARRLKPDVAALEEAFYGKDVRSVLRIGEVRGAILVALRQAGIPVMQFAPAVVKRAVTGNGNAAKSQVAAMVERLVGRQAAGAAEDAADALAVAICCAHRVKGFRPLEAVKNGNRRRNLCRVPT